jgi:TonB family protein
VAAQACATPYTAPKARAGFATEMPAIAAGQGVDSGESIVEVTLSAKGDLVNATIEKSSGNRWLDAAALRNARSTLFIPATTNCEPVGGTYLYVVDF